MKIFAISDLHLSGSQSKPMDIFGGAWINYWQVIKNNWTKYISDDDIVLIAGDISWAMNLTSAITDLLDISSLPGHKVLIRGNHDYWWSTASKLRAIIPEKMYVIQNDAVKIGNIVIAGTRGWICPDRILSEDDNKIYMREEQRLKLSLDKAMSIKEDGDKLICMLHFPPFNARHEASVFTALCEKYNLREVVYGHLHGNNCRAECKVSIRGVNYYLVSCDKLNNMPLQIYSE